MIKQEKLTIVDVLNLVLAIVAFGFFVANQFNVFGGDELELQSMTGRVLLTGFLAVGIVFQLLKFAVGHRNKFGVIVTIALLVAHVVAELAIWFGTQIFNYNLPDNLPQWIIGLYWLLGIAEVLAIYGRREFSLLREGVTKEERLAQQLVDSERKALEAEIRAQVAEEKREWQEQVLSQTRPAIAQPSPAVAPANAEPPPSDAFSRSCPGCGKTFTATTKRGVANAVNGHQLHCDGVAANNGNK